MSLAPNSLTRLYRVSCYMPDAYRLGSNGHHVVPTKKSTPCDVGGSRHLQTVTKRHSSVSVTRTLVRRAGGIPQHHLT